MRHVFEAKQWVPFARPLVFAFFANPRNLPPLMPAWQQARIVEATLCAPPPRPTGTPPYPGVAAGSGTRLTITARGLPGLPLRAPWDALIEDFRWNEGFCDVQLKGPFAYWRHCHSVRDEMRESVTGTVIHDHVTFELPLSPLSEPGLPVAKAAMAALFRYRQTRASELLPEFAKLAEQTDGSC